MHAVDPGIGRSTDLSPFKVFSLIYATAIMLEMMEYWTYVPATLVLLALVILLVWRTTLLTFSALLLVSNIYFVYFRFPDVANHVNLMIFSSTAILLAIAVQKLRNRRAGEGEIFEGMQPALRLLIIITLTVAGFHKFNTDFVDPAVSCAGSFASSVFWALGMDFFGLGIPAFLVLAVALLVSVVLFLRTSREVCLPAVGWRSVAVPLVAVLLIGSMVLMMVGTVHLEGPKQIIFFGIAIFVLCWQLVEGPLLLFPRYQWMALTFSIIVHATIAMAQVADFQAIAIALLVAFIPKDVWSAWRTRSRVRIGRLSINRGAFYLFINLFGGMLMLIHYHFIQFLSPLYVTAGVLFNIGLLVLLWPILTDLFSADRSWRWTGVPVLHPATPRIVYLVPAFLLGFGLTSYLGLRTTGNFSMFSNLRTEGPFSNHLILGNNPFKIWGYQEDVVEIVEFEQEQAKIGHHYALDKGLKLPVVEFRKLLYLWRQAGIEIPMTLNYQGKTLVSSNIANEPGWIVDDWDWEMRLLDFRVIQSDSPNQCRW